MATFALVVNCNTAYFIYPHIDENGTRKNHEHNHLNLSRPINPCQTGDTISLEDTHSLTLGIILPQLASKRVILYIHFHISVDISLIICHTYFVSQAVFSFFFLMWNSMVAVVFVSLGKTLAMKIKKFILLLECDAFLLDKKFSDTFYGEKAMNDTESLKGMFHVI